MLRGKTLTIEVNAPPEMTIGALKAVASLPRWRILEYLADGGHSVTEIAQALDMPSPTAAAHIKLLEEAGFIHSELQPASHGLQKFCTRTYDNMVVQFPFISQAGNASIEVSMPIGAYTRFDVSPTCGLATPTSIIGYLDDPLSFYEPDRLQASLIWFRSGYLEYSFPNRLPQTAGILSVQVSMEICAEAPLHNNHWPSDITLWINELEIGTWTCPSDFGGQRGQLTPAWWASNDTQYGLLKRWTVTSDGTYIDGRSLSDVTVRDLALDQQRGITVRLGVKPDGLHVGGLNLFGRYFGNYPQDLTLRLEYKPGERRFTLNDVSSNGSRAADERR
jgi:predicted transcriptional regulator